MNTRRLVTLITFLGIFAMAARISVDTDTWWHLRTAEWIVENGRLPTTDPFSYTRLGQGWPHPGWLVQLPMLGIYRLAGPGGLNLWTAGMVTLAFYLVRRRMAGGPFLQAFVLVLAAAASGVYWAARPYLATFVLAAAFLDILEPFQVEITAGEARRRVLWLGLLMVVWANSHGGFMAGFLIWGACLAGAGWRALTRREWRSPVFWMLVAGGPLLALAVCLNPHGPQMLFYAFKTVSIGALQDYIQEWQSPDFHQAQVQPFAWLLFLALGAVGLSRRRLSLTDFLLVSGLAYLGLMAGRNIALFALAAPLVICRHLAPVVAAVGRRLGWRGLGERKPNRPLAVVNSLLLGLVVLAVLAKAATIYPREVNERHFETILPVQAVSYLRETAPPGRLFNSYNWGAYLLWALPEYPVFIDGRTDLYNDEVISQWLRVMRAEAGWQDLLESYGVKVVLVERGATLDKALEMEPGWEQRYADTLAVVYVRSR